MHKQKIIHFTKDELDALIEDANSCVTINKTTYSLALYPYHLSNVSESIKRLLNAKVAKYDQRLDGILLGYKNLKLITPYASLRADSCYIHVDIQGEFFIFKPKVGATLKGVANKTSSNHIGCLVHTVFNVSVPNINKNENEDEEEERWPGSYVKIGSIVELLVTKTDLDARLPYIQALILSCTRTKKSKNDSLTENGSPKKQKTKTIHFSRTGSVIDNDTESEFSMQETETTLNNSTKKQKKKRLSENVNENENTVETTEETPTLNESTKNKKKKKNPETEIDNNIEITEKTPTLNEPLKKQRKKKHSETKTETENNFEITDKNLNKSLKKQKKKQHPEQSEDSDNNNAVPSSGDSNKKQKKKNRHSDKTDNQDIKVEELSQKTLILNESQKKQKKKHPEEPEDSVNNNELSSEDSNKKQKKKNRHSDKIDNLEMKVEELSQKTLILNESQKKSKKQQSQDLEANKITPKKQTNQMPSDSQRTNESDYFATPKIKKNQKQPAETNKPETPKSILEKGSLEDFVPKEKKPKKRNSNKLESDPDANTKSESAKKKSKKNGAINVEELQSALLLEQLHSIKEPKKEKKRKSKDVQKSAEKPIDVPVKPMNLSPIKPMADLEDRKTKKHRQSLSQNVDWQNKELNLYDSDLEKTLNTPSDKKNMSEKSLEFNLAKIEALNANTPRKLKRKRKLDDIDDGFIQVGKKSKKGGDEISSL